MPYTGNVEVGGPPDTRDLSGLALTKIAVGPYDNNAYVLRCTATGDQLLIDAANEPSRLLEVLGDRPLGRVVTTHRHQDHWQALQDVVQATGAPVSAHPFDAEPLPVPVAEPVENGDTLRVGEATLEVIHLRGHTPGSIALLYTAPDRPHLFTGDSLFPGGIGGTWGDPGKFKQLITDVTERIFDRLPDETWVYPGHGKDTTLGKERPSIPAWWERGW
ncbi:MBL fold metallo-hydrolase [Actinomadura rupiterrae]|uniref:MBL fold metallo-hydrolase n=1 Tax=Actinomadura rupiterrae TaxID=559627 RepID=UPI0020A263B6|nr:MBL fold metallo-hydrolase [Actinomadura rupiterrae]MCP2341186.1 glyoxylase-like metal-dependent hydrolase (beta-lactamase superfamily II) [Actinomadura rupiterrae]